MCSTPESTLEELRKLDLTKLKRKLTEMGKEAPVTRETREFYTQMILNGSEEYFNTPKKKSGHKV